MAAGAFLMALAFQSRIITLGLAFPCAFHRRWIGDMNAAANIAQAGKLNGSQNGKLVVQMIS
jgi:hypothetical protein